MVGMNTGCEGIRRRHDTALYHPHTLSNGIVVWLQKSTLIPSNEGFLFIVFSGVGGRLDPANRPGVAHYFEHIPHRGTVRYPSREALMNPVAELGGSADVANTTADRIIYAAFLPEENLRTAAETIFEIAENPLLRTEDIELERDAILKEYEKQQSSGDIVSSWCFLRALYGEHPLGSNVLGTPDSIRAITPGDVRAFHERFYHAGNLVLFCGGAFAERNDAIRTLEKQFGSIRAGQKTDLTLDHPIPFKKTGRVRVHEPKAGRDSIRMAWLLPTVTARDAVAITELGRVLSYGTSSPLFKELRESGGLVYEHNLVRCESRHDASLIRFLCPTEKKHFSTAERIFFDVLQGLDSSYVVECHRRAQLERKRTFLTPRIACYDPVDTPDAIDDLLVYRRPISHHERETLHDSLTLESIFRWRDFLLETKPFVVEIHAD